MRVTALAYTLAGFSPVPANYIITKTPEPNIYIVKHGDSYTSILKKTHGKFTSEHELAKEIYELASINTHLPRSLADHLSYRAGALVHAPDGIPDGYLIAGDTIFLKPIRAKTPTKPKNLTNSALINFDLNLPSSNENDFILLGLDAIAGLGSYYFLNKRKKIMNSYINKFSKEQINPRVNARCEIHDDSYENEPDYEMVPSHYSSISEAKKTFSAKHPNSLSNLVAEPTLNNSDSLITKNYPSLEKTIVNSSIASIENKQLLSSFENIVNLYLQRNERGTGYEKTIDYIIKTTKVSASELYRAVASAGVSRRRETIHREYVERKNYVHYHSNESTTSLAQKLNVSKTTIYRYRRAARDF